MYVLMSSCHDNIMILLTFHTLFPEARTKKQTTPQPTKKKQLRGMQQWVTHCRKYIYSRQISKRGYSIRVAQWCQTTQRLQSYQEHWITLEVVKFYPSVLNHFLSNTSVPWMFLICPWTELSTRTCCSHNCNVEQINSPRGGQGFRIFSIALWSLYQLFRHQDKLVTWNKDIRRSLQITQMLHSCCSHPSSPHVYYIPNDETWNIEKSML